MSSPDELNPLVANHPATDTNSSKLMELLRQKVDEGVGCAFADGDVNNAEPERVSKDSRHQSLSR